MKKETNLRKDIPYIHVARLFACVGVLMLHCNNRISFNDSYDADFAEILHTLAQPCVPIFFMITGALLLPYSGDDWMGLYKKRIPKVLYPLITWGIIYSILPYFYTGASLKSIVYNLLLLPINFPAEIGGILWYLYVLIGVYLIIPFISPNVYKDNRLINVYLILWAVYSFTFIVRLYKPEILGENHWMNNSNTLSYFSGYLCFLFLGFKLHKRCLGKTRNGLIGGVTCLCLAYIVTWTVRTNSLSINWGAASLVSISDQRYCLILCIQGFTRNPL